MHSPLWGWGGSLAQNLRCSPRDKVQACSGLCQGTSNCILSSALGQLPWEGRGGGEQAGRPEETGEGQCDPRVPLPSSACPHQPVWHSLAAAGARGFHREGLRSCRPVFACAAGGCLFTAACRPPEPSCSLGSAALQMTSACGGLDLPVEVVCWIRHSPGF